MKAIDHGARIALAHGLTRSPLWPKARRLHLQKQGMCVVCGRDPRGLNVHHKYPFHYVVLLGRPDLELDERNLFTLDVDEQHHILVGHLGSYESYNPQLEHMASVCRHLTPAQIHSLAAFQTAMHARPKPIGQMTAREKDAMRNELDRLLPKLNPTR